MPSRVEVENPFQPAPGADPHLGDVASAFGVPSSSISSIRTNLIRKGIVFSPGSGKVQFRMPLADRYVRERGIGRDTTRERAVSPPSES